MTKDYGRSPADAGSGSQASPGAAEEASPPSVSIPNADDGRREVHGMRIKEGLRGCPQVVRETDTHILLGVALETKLSPASARHLARTLYRLARRIEKRAASAIEARSGETSTQIEGSTEGESAARSEAEGDAQTTAAKSRGEQG